MSLTLKKVFAITLIFFFSTLSSAQSSLNYTTTTNVSASLLIDKNGNSINLSAQPNLIPNTNWSNNSSLLDIGFGFVFMGKYYSHFIAGYNGLIGLGLASSPTNIILPGVGNLLSRNVTYPPTAFAAPIIAAFWDDLRTSSTGPTVRTILVGSAPKRCRVIAWNVAINFTSATGTDPSDGVFQMRLYEGSGEIEYVYGKMQIGTGSGTVTASIGFTSGNTDNSFIAVKELSSFTVTRLVSEEAATQSLVNNAAPGPIAGLHSTTEGSRRFILFRPVACNGDFVGANTSRVLATTMQLNWSDNITNKFGYLIYRSVVDSNNYQFVANLPASATNYVANNLNTNTRYYWKIVPYTEGNTNTIMVLTDSTRCSMKGIYKVGPGGDFSGIKSAQDSLALWGMADAITWELLPSFNFALENLPVQFKSLAPCHEKNYTLTIRPSASSSFNFINSSAAPVFLIDSSINIIIDGRAAGSGPIALILEGPGELIKIRNGWNNQINFIEFKSDVSSSTVSPVSIEGSTGGGSYLNSISNCVLHDRGSSYSLPFQLIRSVINNGAPNFNNTVSSCSFYNFRRVALDIDGKGWTIRDNSFFGTVPINATDSSGFINISTNDNSLKNQITGNYFGGSGPNCTGNVLIWNSSWFFNGIGVNASAVIKNNQFKRIKLTTHPTVATTSYIDLVRAGKLGSGGVTIDFTIEKNQFGDLNPADSISFISNTASSVKSTIVRTVGPGAGIVDSNTMVYIHTSVIGSSSDLSLNLVENVLGSTITISKNILSSAQHSYRITHQGSGMMTAFYTWGRATMTDNIITNIVAKNKIAGIMTQLDSYNDPSLNGSITGNTISYIKTSESVDGFDNYSAVGIAAYGSSVLIERNKILHVEDSSMLQSPLGAVSIFSKNCNNTISRNLIDGLLQNPAVPYSKYMKAFSMEDDRSVIMNNMIRLGVDSAGKAVPMGSFVGYTNTSTTNNLVIHNSFYITGNGGNSPTTNISYCIFYTGPSTFVNNILVNNRPNSTGNLNSIYSTSSGSQTNYTDYNVCYHVPDNGLFAIGYPGNLSFQQWVSLGKDVHSVLLPPNFVLPDAPTRLLDLHITSTSAAEHAGTSGSYTTIYDYDGDVRADNSPVDIGADAPKDIVTAVPNISGLQDLKVIPNPNNGLFAVKMKLNTIKDVSFKLYNLIGQAVYETPVNHFSGTQTKQINRSDLASGIYFLQIKIGKESFTQKILVSR